jgi:hypothetical protein
MHILTVGKYLWSYQQHHHAEIARVPLRARLSRWTTCAHVSELSTLRLMLRH